LLPDPGDYHALKTVCKHSPAAPRFNTVRVDSNRDDWEFYCRKLVLPYTLRSLRTGTYASRYCTRRQIRKKCKSAREMQNSSIAHFGIGSTLEDDNTTSTPPIFVVPSAILGVFDLSHRSNNRGCYIMSARLSSLLIDAMKTKRLLLTFIVV
jgi:hypothetical protein